MLTGDNIGSAPRADEASGIYHALNRGNAKNPIFFKDADNDGFAGVRLGFRFSASTV